jgi:hypothetical protein
LVEAPHAGVMISFGFGWLSLLVFMFSSSIIVSVLCTLDQCILWGLTAYKYRDAIRRGLSANPIIRLVMRDTSWSCLAICCKQWKLSSAFDFTNYWYSLGIFITTVPSSLAEKEVGHVVYW